LTTTYVDFQPNPVGPFTFQATLDGVIYTIVVAWNLFGRRYYVNCYSLNGTLAFSVPLIGSPAGINIQSITWADNQVFIETVSPHGLPVGTTSRVTVSGCTPDAYNGTYDTLVLDSSTIVYDLTSNPGTASVLGALLKNINIAGGYFDSLLIFRGPNNQFEISP